MDSTIESIISRVICRPAHFSASNLMSEPDLTSIAMDLAAEPTATSSYANSEDSCDCCCCESDCCCIPWCSLS